MTETYVESFQVKPADKIVIEKFARMSDQRDSIPAQQTTTISDTSVIRQVVSLLNELSDEGDMMIKMGDVSLTKVSLVYGDSAVYFEYYDKRIKTPATSFFSAASREEQDLYSLLLSRL